MPKTLRLLYCEYMEEKKTPSKYEKWKKDICTRPMEYENFDWWALQHPIHRLIQVCPNGPFMCCPLCRNENKSDPTKFDKLVEREKNGEEVFPYKDIVISCYVDYHIDIEFFNKLNKNYKRLPCRTFMLHIKGNKSLEKEFPWWGESEDERNERLEQNSKLAMEIFEEMKSREYTCEYHKQDYSVDV